MAGYRHKGLLIDGVFAYTQATGHLRTDSTAINGSTAITAQARNRSLFGPCKSFNERTFILTTCCMLDCFG